MSSTCVFQQSTTTTSSVFRAATSTSKKSIIMNKSTKLGIICEEIKSESHSMESILLHHIKHNSHPAFRGNNLSLDKSASTDPNEICSGFLTLYENENIEKVFMSVIRTSVDHLAVVYPATAAGNRNSNFRHPICSINLRGFRAERLTMNQSIVRSIPGFVLRPKKCDTSTVSSPIFLCQDESSLQKWMTALSNNNTPNLLSYERGIPRKSSLPMLSEESEDDEEEDEEA